MTPIEIEHINSMFNLFFHLMDNEQVKAFKEDLSKNYKKGIIFSGVGKNWYIAEKVVKTYLSMGIPAQALDPVHGIHGDIGMVNDQFIILMSRSGTTQELVYLAKVLRKLNTLGVTNSKLVGLSLNPNKPFSEYFDYYIAPDKSYENKIYEFDERNLVPSLSINCCQLVLDKIGVEVFEDHQELVDRYKYNHIGGANGKKLGMEDFNV